MPCFRSLFTGTLAAFVGSLAIGASPAAAQALVVPEGDEALPRTFREGGADFAITKLDITAAVANRSADVTVAQTVKNTGESDLRLQFLFPLPDEAIVDGMTLLVDGKEFPAKLLAKKEARDRFESIVRAKQDPALLEWSGGRYFQTQVFPVPVGAERTVTVHYTRLLEANFGLANLDLPLSAATISRAPVKQLTIRATIREDDLRTVYSPTHTVSIDRSTTDAAIVSFEAADTVPGQDFQLLYDTAAGEETAGRLLTYRPNPNEDGYFLFIATPPPAKADETLGSKTTMMVLDKSGSMNGEKIDQAREAMRYVLDNLGGDDLFNVVTYSDTPSPLFPELQRATGKPLADAQVFAAGVAAGGGTNIHDALTAALSQLNTESDDPNYLLFLTDGLPTVGVQDETEIAKAVAAAGGNVRLISFGVGFDVNSRLLDRLSTENRGFSEYVQPSENIESAVSRVYRRLTTPVLVDAELSFDFETKPTATPTNHVMPSGPVDLFAGQEMIVVGRYRHSGDATVRLAGTRDGQSVTKSFAGTFAKQSSDGRLSFIEKLWATRRIGAIINQMDLDGKNDELIDELVALSTKHGILTQYTSFLADEDAVTDQVAIRREVGDRISGLQRQSGRSGFSQRAVKNYFTQNGQFAAPAAGNAVQEKSLELQAIDGEASPMPAYSPGFAAPPQPSRMGRRNTQVFGVDAITDFGSPADSGAAAGEQPQAEADRSPTVQTAGGVTLYRRGNQLRTVETLDVNTDKETPTTIARFSKEYFDLYAANTAEENALLGRQEKNQELLVRLRGTLYLIK